MRLDEVSLALASRPRHGTRRQNGHRQRWNLCDDYVLTRPERLFGRQSLQNQSAGVLYVEAYLRLALSGQLVRSSSKASEAWRMAVGPSLLQSHAFV